MSTDHNCTCLGSCRGAVSLAPGWRCALAKIADTIDASRLVDVAARAYTSAALANLGRQLTIAAGLTRAWNNGVDECAGWSPGCREEMP